MALTTCPNCGKPVSDKAIKCISCGIELKSEALPLVEKETVKCSDCGANNPSDAAVCSTCGCPLGVDSVTQSNKEEKKSKKHTVVLVSVIAIVVVAILAVVFIFMRQKQVLADNTFHYLELAATIHTDISESEKNFNYVEECNRIVNTSGVSIGYDSVKGYADSITASTITDETNRYERVTGLYEELNAIGNVDDDLDVLKEDLESLHSSYSDRYNDAIINGGWFLIDDRNLSGDLEKVITEIDRLNTINNNVQNSN